MQTMVCSLVTVLGERDPRLPSTSSISDKRRSHASQGKGGKPQGHLLTKLRVVEDGRQKVCCTMGRPTVNGNHEVSTAGLFCKVSMIMCPIDVQHAAQQ